MYLLKVINRNSRTRCEVCSKLTIKTSWRLYWCNCRLGLIFFWNACSITVTRVSETGIERSSLTVKNLTFVPNPIIFIVFRKKSFVGALGNNQLLLIWLEVRKKIEIIWSFTFSQKRNLQPHEGTKKRFPFLVIV